MRPAGAVVGLSARLGSGTVERSSRRAPPAGEGAAGVAGSGEGSERRWRLGEDDGTSRSALLSSAPGFRPLPLSRGRSRYRLPGIGRKSGGRVGAPRGGDLRHLPGSGAGRAHRHSPWRATSRLAARPRGPRQCSLLAPADARNRRRRSRSRAHRRSTRTRPSGRPRWSAFGCNAHATRVPPTLLARETRGVTIAEPKRPGQGHLDEWSTGSSARLVVLRHDSLPVTVAGRMYPQSARNRPGTRRAGGRLSSCPSPAGPAA
jgi:hypothetical protein